MFLFIRPLPLGCSNAPVVEISLAGKGAGWDSFVYWSPPPPSSCSDASEAKISLKGEGGGVTFFFLIVSLQR